MSGPITAGFFLVHGALLLSARALREAQAMRREMGAVRARLDAREDEIARARRGLAEARAQGEAAKHARLEEEQARMRPRHSVAEGTGDSGGTTPDAFVAPVAAIPPAPSIDEVLADYVRQRHARAGLDASDTAQLASTAARVLERLELLEGEPLPADLEALAREIVLAPTLDRGEALATELRHRVQAHRERAEQEAAAFVLEQSLRDLGYEVEDIEATLFADGGAVHFRRPGWERYFVRLRVDAKERTVNFNVVRARGEEETPERLRRDALAEDRWCAEFPRLLQTLEARGLRLEVTRRLEAGELPVQVVDETAVPRIAQDEAGARGPASAPRARPLG